CRQTILLKDLAVCIFVASLLFALIFSPLIISEKEQKNWNKKECLSVPVSGFIFHPFQTLQST
ncbi:hypothetical protein NOM07_19475, partial [Proteus terrae]|nr:hypothetical protein [Proteus terrae]